MSGLVAYPCPLRDGRFADLRLPSDLTAHDVIRITRYITTLLSDSEQEKLRGAEIPCQEQPE